MENPIKMDDLGVPLFLETPMFCYDYDSDEAEYILRAGQFLYLSGSI